MTGKRKNQFRMKLLSVLLTAGMLAGSISTSAFAAADEMTDAAVKTEVTAEVTTEITDEEPVETPQAPGGAPETPETEEGKPAENTEGTQTEASNVKEDPEKPAGTEVPTVKEDPEKPAETQAPTVKEDPEKPAETEVPTVEEDTDKPTEAEEAEPVDYASLEEFHAAIAAMGDADDLESVLAVLDNCLSVYFRLSPEDQAEKTEEYNYIVEYREKAAAGDPDAGIETTALISGEQFTVTVVKVVNGQKVDSITLTEKCLQSTRHSGYNHSTNLRTLANESGFSGYKGYNWSQYTTVPSTYTSGLAPNSNYTSVHYNITGSAPYKANETLFLFFEEGKTFTLNYDANGGSGAPARQTATSTGSSYTFTISASKPTRDGYTFKGWSTSSTATSPSYYSGGKIEVTSTTTLYAVWEKNAPVDNGRGIEVTKTRTSSKTIEVGGTITWKIEVTNNSNVEKTVTLTEQEGVILSESSVRLAAGETKTVTASYEVTGNENLINGYYYNTVKATTGGEGDRENPEDTDDGTEIITPVKTKTIPVTPSVTFEVESRDMVQLTREQISEDYVLTLTYTDGDGDHIKTFRGSDANWSETDYLTAVWPSFDVKVPDVAGGNVVINVTQSNYLVGNNSEFVYNRTYTVNSGDRKDGAGSIKVSKVSYAMTVNSKNYYNAPQKPALTDITKELVGSAPASVKAGESVTLTYKITVTGDNGASYTVSDPGATLVSGSWSGTLDESGKAEITVTKTVTAIEAGTMTVKNTAYVKPGDNTKPVDPDDPPDGHPSNEVETEIRIDNETEDRIITIKYVYEDGNPIPEKPDEIKDKNSDSQPYRDDDLYDPADWVKEGDTVDIGDPDHHYIVEKVEDPNGGVVKGNVTIIVTVVLDDIADPNNDGNGDEEGDGIPDKYQAIVNYVAGANGTVTGTTTKVITLKDDNGAYVVSKNMVVGTEGVTVTPNENYKFEGWNPDPTVESNIEGGKTYTYTANFETSMEPTDPTDPEEPTDPTEPENPTNPTDPEEPTNPTDPEEPTNPTDPEEPTNPTDPEDPINPTDPEEPTNPTEPEDPATPEEPNDSVPEEPAPQPVPSNVVPTPVPVAPVVPEVTPVQPTEAPTVPVESIEENSTPLAEPEIPEEEVLPVSEEITDEALPLAAGRGRSWALVNFALMNLAVFETLMLLIGYFVNTKKASEEEEEEQEKKLKKKGIMRLISLPVAIISIIAFCLTEDITLPTGFVDRWTLLMAIIAIVQTVIVALSRKKEEDEEARG